MHADSSEIETQFDAAAAEYDSGRRKFIPCFDEFYEGTTEFVSTLVTAPRRIVDLGAGTGLLSMCFFRHFPTAEYLLVDIAEEMLKVAERRFSGLKNVRCRKMDYSVELPEEEFDLVISALSVHHLTDDGKRALFRRIRKRLSPGQWFVNYDQFCGETPYMSEHMDRHWISRLVESGLPGEELERWRERRGLDRECSVTDGITMLRGSGFATAECIYRDRKVAVIAAMA